MIDIFSKSGMYGVEWLLLNFVESYLIKEPWENTEYREMITACPSEEWREMMQVRLDNWENEGGETIINFPAYRESEPEGQSPFRRKELIFMKEILRMQSYGGFFITAARAA